MAPPHAEMVFDASVAGFTKDDVRALAGEKSFERGIEYIRAVADLETNGEAVYATVQGNDLYEVELHVGPPGLRGTCDCPWGQEGNFCKHCVAVALVYEYDREHGRTMPNRSDLRSRLELLGHAELVDIVLELADGDRELRRHLRGQITR